MLARALGLLVALGGLTVIRRARSLTDGSLRLSRDVLDWEGGRLLRFYGVAVTAATGMIMVAVGLSLVVRGTGALPD